MSARAAFAGRRVLVSAIGIGVVAVVLVSVLATRGLPTSQTAATTLGGHDAPAIFGRDLRTDREVSLAEMRGEYVVVDFFASWCVPCQTESPALEAFTFAHQKHHDATVLGVLYADEPSNARAFFKQYGLTWPAVEDPNSTFAIDYGVTSPAQVFVVAPNGKVIARRTGSVTEAELDTVIEANGGTG